MCVVLKYCYNSRVKKFNKHISRFQPTILTTISQSRTRVLKLLTKVVKFSKRPSKVNPIFTPVPPNNCLPFVDFVSHKPQDRNGQADDPFIESIGSVRMDGSAAGQLEGAGQGTAHWPLSAVSNSVGFRKKIPDGFKLFSSAEFFCYDQLGEVKTCAFKLSQTLIASSF